MRAINSAYRVLSDPRQRATYDAQRFLRTMPTRRAVTPAGAAVVRPSSAAATRPTAYATTAAREAVASPYDEPTELQRRVDRVVAVIGVILLILIGTYAAFVIPRSEQQFQNGLRGTQPSSAPPEPVAAATHTTGTSGSVPDRLRLDAGLHSFPGTVLVPPSTLAPFKSLPILRLDETGQGIARYAVYYGDLTTGVASISGLIGRQSFDNAAPKLPDCAADAAYCAGPGSGQTASDPPGVEVFRSSDLVGDDPAFVTHRVCCNGVFWSLSWYEPNSNMSYTIDLSRSVAELYGSPRAEHDAIAARAVAALASQLVRLP